MSTGGGPGELGDGVSHSPLCPHVWSPVWPHAWRAEDLPGAPGSAPSCAEPAVLCRATPQCLRQAWQLSWWPRGRATYGLVPEQSKRAAPHPRAPRGGCELPHRPQGLPWLHSQLGRGRRPSSPWRLAAAVCSLGPAPWTLAPDKAWGRAQHHSPWEQVPPSWGHAATQLLLLGDVAPGYPAGEQRLSAPCQRPLKAAPWLCGRGWWLPASSTTMPGSGTSTPLLGQGGRRAWGCPHGGLSPSQVPEGSQEQS